MNTKLMPPMGWNSYDYYDTAVTEQEVKENADFMAKYLKPYGWEYVVVDIEWYAYGAGTRRDEHQYIPFSDLEMDEYSRLFPCTDRFPSSKDGKGFKPLADYVHSLGLKFGIHIMRGIPRIAAHLHKNIKGCDLTANEIALPNSICYWNPDMYGVDPNKKEGQMYYDSLFELYAEWGVDFIKCDDICRMDAESSKAEIQMLANAIEKCGRDIVLSLSPGPAMIEEADFYHKTSNMWRITDDFWDSWPLLLNMFDRCRIWEGQAKDGGYPDCDMLPVGSIGKGFADPRKTRFTEDEQKTMMTLWCMVRSPLMLGAYMPDLKDDDFTMSLLTNEKLLSMLNETTGAKEAFRNDDLIIWRNESIDKTEENIAIFNITEKDIEITPAELLKKANIQTSTNVDRAIDLWTKDTISFSEKMTLSTHAVSVFSVPFEK